MPSFALSHFVISKNNNKKKMNKSICPTEVKEAKEHKYFQKFSFSSTIDRRCWCVFPFSFIPTIRYNTESTYFFASICYFFATLFVLTHFALLLVFDVVVFYGLSHLVVVADFLELQPRHCADDENETFSLEIFSYRFDYGLVRMFLERWSKLMNSLNATVLNRQQFQNTTHKCSR